MIGAIAGDVVGSVHERRGTKTVDFPLLTRRSRFTDDSHDGARRAHAGRADAGAAGRRRRVPRALPAARVSGVEALAGLC
jgi:hypothetical protein